MDGAVEVVKAELSDARLLTSIQAEAFDHEADLFRMETDKGPAGYDSVDWTRAAIETGNMLKIIKGTEVIGGILITLLKEGKARLNRIFVDPGQQGKGAGSRAIQILRKMYPEIKTWELDTPSWAVRNQRFYERNGFVREGHTLEPSTGFILYIYRMHPKEAQ
ncbi:MAG: Acetyltransferase (GNAT) family protein [Methanomassiliicoccales archaeon PtaU1.Bin124]|nr:MAG: Acetyltransferase (GNAT) family protein [Methanomassiliicoccales archaeon PtaU1.Bin124]